MKPPKDFDKFIEPKLAAARLIYFALEKILFARGKVRWQITIRCFDLDYKNDPSTSPVKLMCGTFSSEEPV
jgi:hypothetical protein